MYNFIYVCTSRGRYFQSFYFKFILLYNLLCSNVSSSCSRTVHVQLYILSWHKLSLNLSLKQRGASHSWAIPKNVPLQGDLFLFFLCTIFPTPSWEQSSLASYAVKEMRADLVLISLRDILKRGLPEIVNTLQSQCIHRGTLLKKIRMEKVRV
jgi:hypothetical protein